MMRVECVQCQQRQACPTPPEGPRQPDSYDVLLEKTSELRHVQQIVYIVKKRKTHKKLNLQCLIASTSLKLSKIVANKSQQLCLLNSESMFLYNRYKRRGHHRC